MPQASGGVWCYERHFDAGLALLNVRRSSDKCVSEEEDAGRHGQRRICQHISRR